MFFGGPRQQDVPQVTLRIGTEPIKQVDGARFLGIWVDHELKWTEHINKVKNKVGQLLGVIGRVSSILDQKSLQTLYNGIVLPHLQYCLIVWGDFVGGRNKTLGGSLLKCQKKFAGMISQTKGRYHSDPLFAKHGMLKIDDLYRQQLRMHAWQFWNGCLPQGPAGMFQKTTEHHRYATRSAGSGIAIETRDQGSIRYRLPKEWSLIPDELKHCKSITGFKNGSKRQLVEQYSRFECTGIGCVVCGDDAPLTSHRG